MPREKPLLFDAEKSGGSQSTNISLSNRRENESRLWLYLQFIQAESTAKEEEAGTKEVWPLDNSQPYQRRDSPAPSESHTSILARAHLDNYAIEASVCNRLLGAASL